MRWIGEHIWDLISRFRGDVYLENISDGDVANDKFLGLDSSGKIVKETVTGGGGASGDLTDVTLTDQDSNAVAANDILVWTGGSGFQTISMQDMINNPALFTFAFNSFNDNVGTSVLMGPAGTQWKGSSTMNFDAGYTAGPPDGAADVYMGNNTTTDGSMSKVGEFTNTAKTEGTNNQGAINYPSSRSDYYVFQARITNDSTVTKIPESTSDKYAQRIYFHNNIYYGASTDASLGASVNGLTASVSNTETTSRSITTSGNKYIYLAYPKAGNNTIHANGFKFDGVTTPFETVQEVTVSNSASFSETYYIYRSTNTFNLSSKLLQLSTSASLTNHIFSGKTTNTTANSVSHFSSISQQIATNTNTRTWNSINAGSGEYILFAWPSRLSTPGFSVGGFSGGFPNIETGNYTNANGFTEEYRFFRSNNANLGATVVITS